MSSKFRVVLFFSLAGFMFGSGFHNVLEGDAFMAVWGVGFGALDLMFGKWALDELSEA